MEKNVLQSFLNHNIECTISDEEIIDTLIKKSFINNSDQREDFIEALSKVETKVLLKIINLLDNKIDNERNVTNREIDAKKQMCAKSILQSCKDITKVLKEATEKNLLSRLDDCDDEHQNYQYLLSKNKIGKNEFDVADTYIRYIKAQNTYYFAKVYYGMLLDEAMNKADLNIKSDKEINLINILMGGAIQDALQKYKKAYYDYINAEYNAGNISLSEYNEQFQNLEVGENDYRNLIK